MLVTSSREYTREDILARILVRHVRHARFPRDLLATSSRGCHEDATMKTASLNLSFTLYATRPNNDERAVESLYSNIVASLQWRWVSHSQFTPPDATQRTRPSSWVASGCVNGLLRFVVCAFRVYDIQYICSCICRHSHFGFLKSLNFICYWGPEFPDASACQILSKWVNRLRRY